MTRKAIVAWDEWNELSESERIVGCDSLAFEIGSLVGIVVVSG